MKNKLHDFLYDILMWLEGEEMSKCEECPLGWCERLMDDWDSGCYVGGEEKITIWCFAPKWIKRLKLKHLRHKEIKYWTKVVDDDYYETLTKEFEERKENDKRIR